MSTHDDLHAHDRTDPGLTNPGLDPATLAQHNQPSPDEDHTDPGLTRPGLDQGQATTALSPEARAALLARNPDHAATQELPVYEPTLDDAEEPAPARKRSTLVLAGLGLLGILLLAAAALFLFLGPGASPVTAVMGEPEPTEKDLPPALRVYYERAATGDASAMRMLGTMYYNGLNVPRNTREGIRWYRKAATAGSVAARKDLEQLGLSATGK